MIIFPNYPLMKTCFAGWSKIINKPCFIEQKNSEKTQKEINKYLANAASSNGAVLFCVSRGKFAEGYNFNDSLCRSIIMIGVPNLNITAPKVQLKKLYLKDNGYSNWYNR